MHMNKRPAYRVIDEQTNDGRTMSSKPIDNQSYYHPSWYLLVQSQHWKYHSKV